MKTAAAQRRISDTPGGLVKELRLYRCFFPAVFREDGNPLGQSLSNWIKIRRALLRKPFDRLGYGGYLSFASESRGEIRRFIHAGGGLVGFRGPSTFYPKSGQAVVVNYSDKPPGHAHL